MGTKKVYRLVDELSWFSWETSTHAAKVQEYKTSEGFSYRKTNKKGNLYVGSLNILIVKNFRGRVPTYSLYGFIGEVP